jgi:hypothetical protein
MADGITGRDSTARHSRHARPHGRVKPMLPNKPRAAFRA